MSRFFAQLLKGRIAGHPVHSMLIHFPSALFPVSLLFDVLSVLIPNAGLEQAAFYCLAAGIIFGFIAMIFGTIDYVRIPPTHPAWNTASLHALLNSIWIILFAIVFGLKFRHFPQVHAPTLLEIILETLGVIGLIYSNYLGGDLVLRYKIGSDNK